jgi:rfaE bifunctional protein kinase chain/domain
MTAKYLAIADAEQILARVPMLTVGVLGDLFLDRYLDINPALTEPSLETGLDAHQVTGVRSCPGAAGTVINNLVALGVKEVCGPAVIGDDGEGYELVQALDRLNVSSRWLVRDPSRRTPTYTKPMLGPRELNRLDIKNRSPLPPPAEAKILSSLAELWPRLDALIVVDQVREADCGVVTATLRNRLADLGAANPQRLILADSRQRIGLFRSVWLKPNQGECVQAIPGEVTASARALAGQCGRPVFCTQGEKGMLVIDPRTDPCGEWSVPSVPVTGPIDPVGAGDSVSAALACALAAGASLVQAAAFANIVASITIRQLGSTGTASPAQIRKIVRSS